MALPEKYHFGLDSAQDDWKAANDLFEKGDYPYALFFGHLTLEKILKAVYTKRFDKNPPYTHRLVSLAEKLEVTVDDERLELFEVITDFNIEARYPDEQLSFKKKCTKEFAMLYMKKMEELRKWLLEKIEQ